MEYQQAMAAQADLVQETPDVICAFLSSPVPLEVAAFISRAGDHAYHVGPCFKGFQEVLGLEAAGARDDDLVDGERPRGL
jgi:hypothetical protein